MNPFKQEGKPLTLGILVAAIMCVATVVALVLEEQKLPTPKVARYGSGASRVRVVKA